MDLNSIRSLVQEAALKGEFHTGYRLDPIELSKRCVTLCKFAEDIDAILTIPCSNAKEANTTGTQFRRIKNLLLEQPWFQDCITLRTALLKVSFQVKQNKLLLIKRAVLAKNPSVGTTQTIVEFDCTNTELLNAYLVVMRHQAIPTSTQVRLNAANLSILAMASLESSIKELHDSQKVSSILVDKTFYISL